MILHTVKRYLSHDVSMQWTVTVKPISSIVEGLEKDGMFVQSIVESFPDNGTENIEGYRFFVVFARPAYVGLNGRKFRIGDFRPLCIATKSPVDIPQHIPYVRNGKIVRRRRTTQKMEVEAYKSRDTYMRSGYTL